MLRVWQTAWVWPFSVQSSFAVCPKKIIVSNLNLHPNMPWPQETLMWECGSGPSMAVSLKSGFKEPRLYHRSFRICQTVHSVGITWYHIPQGSLFVYDSWGRRRRMQIIFWTHTKKTYQSSSGTTKLSLPKKQTFLKGRNYVHKLWIARAGALKWRQDMAFNSLLTRALCSWLLMLHALALCARTATVLVKLAPSYRHKEPMTGPRLLP